MEKTIGLYELVCSSEAKEVTSHDIESYILSHNLPSDIEERLKAWKNEVAFWEEYSDIYANLEKARPYTNLSNVLRRLIEPTEGDIWLDVGCGPLRCSELIHAKSDGKIIKIEAVDIVLKPAKDKLEKLSRLGFSLPVNLKYASVTETLPYPDCSFDGIVANLVLPYVTDFHNDKGRTALMRVLLEMFRILKPGGQLIWSTPQKGVNFIWVFIASIPDMLNLYEYFAHKDFSRIFQGTRILRHALSIQKKR